MIDENPLPLDPTGSKSLMEAQLSLTDFSSLIDLPAKPLAYEPNMNIAGNPIIGANPGLRNDSPNYISAIANKLANQRPEEDPYLALKPFTYSGDYDAANFERYYSTGKLYNKLGFSPYRDNETLYNNKMTVGDQFVRAAKQWDNLVGAGFMSGIRSWKTLFTDPLAPDLEGARDMERAMAIGSSNTGGLSSFFINTFLNSGYTVGIGADFLAEELALTGATVLTGGALGETTIPAMIAKAGSAGKNFFNFLKTADKVEDAFKAAKNINRFDGIRAVDDINTARTFWNTVGGGAKKVVGGVADILNPLDNTIAALRAKDYATDYAKISRTFGAFADDLMMMKGAVAEAKMEGGMSKLNVTKELIDEYRSINGKDPEGEELAKIEAIAQDEAKRTAFWNLPAITTSNKLMYATMLAPFRKIMGRETTKLIDDIVFENKTFRAVGEGMFDRAKVAAKSLAKPKFYGEFGMNYLKANLAEGVQENIQEAISSGASKHAMALYRDPIRGSYEGYMPYFMKGLGEQFSAQGAETFAGGFAMGLFAQPIMGGAGISMSKIMDATLNKKNAEALKEARRKQLHGYTDEQTGEVVKGDIQVLNELYQDHLKYFSPDLENAVRTGRLANDLYAAAREGNKKEAIDAKDGIQTHHIMTALRTGKFDIFMDKLADYKNLTKEEAVEAFGKYGVEAQDADKAMAQIDGVIARAKEIKANYEEGANQYPNPYEPAKFRKDPKKYIAAVVAKKAWDEAVYNMVFAKSTFQQYSQRVADISNKFSQISGDLAGADSQGLMSLLSPKTALQEINNLKKEISVLDANIPEQKKIKTEKTKQLEKLDDFYQAVAEMKHARNEKEKLDAEAKAKKTFSNYVGHLARKNDNIVFDSTIAEAYKMVSDHMLLKDDMAGLARSINVLMAPKSFLEFQKSILNTYDGIFQGRADLLEMNSEEFHLIKDINDITNTITKRTGLMLPEDFILEFAEAKKNKTELPFPEYLVDENGDVVTEGPKFVEALQIWQEFIGEEVIKPETGETTPSKKYDSADFSTYPKDLIEFLKASYDNKKFDETSPYYIGISREDYGNLTPEEQAPYDKEAAEGFEIFATDPSTEPIRRQFFALQNTETTKPAEKTPGLKRPVAEAKPELIPAVEVRAELPKQFQDAENQDVEWQGLIGRIKVYGPDNIVFVTNNVEYEVEKADIFADPAKFGFQGIVKPATIEAAVKPYTVENITEDTVTVNGVDYLINTDTMGNVESLSPTNRPEQQITNNKMMIAVEIERNKLEYRTNQDVVDSAIAEKTALPDATTTVIEGIYVQNFTDTVAEGLDKLYANQSLTPQEQLQVELWAFDALDRVLTLSDKPEYKNNEEVKNAIRNLRQIINELHGTVKAKTETSAKQAPVSKPTEKGKRTIKRESSKKQAEQVKVEGEVIASTRPVAKKAAPVTVESVNANKTLESLKEAKKNKFEVVYKGTQYKIKRINKNSVILSSPNKPDAKVDLEDLDAIKVVQPGAKKFSPEENKSVVENGEVIATTKRTFTEEPNLQELKKAFLNSLCK